MLVAAEAVARSDVDLSAPALAGRSVNDVDADPFVVDTAEKDRRHSPDAVGTTGKGGPPDLRQAAAIRSLRAGAAWGAACGRFRLEPSDEHRNKPPQDRAADSRTPSIFRAVIAMRLAFHLSAFGQLFGSGSVMQAQL